MIKKYFFPVFDREVQKFVDENSTRNIEYISLVVALFEFLTLMVFVMTRKSFGSEELLSICSVLFCIVTCLVGYLCTDKILKRASFNHRQVLIVNAVYYMLMSVWAVWASYRKYINGEQMLTFYATEMMLVCFIALKPWLSTILTISVYAGFYVILYSIDGGAGINILNYIVLTLVSTIGMGVRYHSLIRTAEINVQLRKAKDSEIRDKMSILQAIADIYDKVNLIDFTDMTEMSVRDKEHVKRPINPENQTHTVMSKNLRENVVPDQLDDFILFTDISSVRARLTGKKLISEDFLNLQDGWIRAQYISVATDENGIPLRVVFTIINVDDEKKREELLLRIAMTDELTRIFNRRSYEEDLLKYKENGIQKDFVILSADVNGLKRVNDTKGHAGGDELIKGVADCLVLAVGKKGKVYRIGGDEFVAMLNTDDPEKLCREIEKRAGQWRGYYSDTLSVSIGYASHADNPDLDIDMLEKKADDEMYQSKARYYEKTGVDRRKNR